MTPEELIAFLCDPTVPFAESRDRVRDLPDVRETIAEALNSSVSAADWGTFEYLLFAAATQPDPAYVPAISEALALDAREVPNEDALEVLAEIRDPRALPLLKNIALTEHDWDEFSQIGQKAVWAIETISTPEATEALAEIARRGNEYVQHWAENALKGRRK